MAENARIDELRRRLDREPGSRLFAQLAEELRKDGELAEAIRVARAGLLLHPAYPSAHMTLGRALLDTGDLASARAEFEAVLRGAADNILASRFLGETLEAMGDLGSALLQYRATLRLAPGDRQLEGQIRSLEERLSAPSVRKATPPAVPAPPGPPVVAAAAPAGVAASAPPRPPEPPPVEAPPLPLPVAAPEPPPAPPPPSHVPFVPVSEVSFDLEAPFDTAGTAPPWAAPEPSPGRGLADEAVVEAQKAPAPPGAHVPIEALPTMPEPALTPEPEPPPPPPPPSPPPASAQTPALSSSTLAELYFNQGFTDQAMEVYRELLQREPENERARARLGEIAAADLPLRAEAPPSPGGPATDPRAERRRVLEQTIARLEGVLAAIRRG